VSTKPNISVVVPVYNCTACLFELVNRLTATLSSISSVYEIILINDASLDGAWDVIVDLSKSDTRVKGINLSRNFGQHAAITAGLDNARGEWVVVMDCDLQDLPEEIPRLYDKALMGYDLVVGLRKNRQDPVIKRLLSQAFWKVFKLLSGTAYNHQLGNFGIYSNKVILNISKLREQTRGFGMFAFWVGFKRTEIEVDHGARIHGHSAYTFTKMASFALDLVTSHSDGLLRLTIKVGFIVSFLSLLFGCWLLIRYYLWATPVVGWASLMVSVYFMSGLLMGSIGIVGLYVGKIFNEVKGRPLYIVSQTTFKEEKPTEE
jgi:glycosyltransferase involved in cell wall biosynthesis